MILTPYRILSVSSFLLLFAVVSSPVSTRGSFKVSSYLVKDVLYQADTHRSSVSTEVFVLRSGSPLSPSLYIIPSDDISERRTGSSRALGGQPLK